MIFQSFFFLSFFPKLYCAFDVPFTRYMKLQSLWSLVVSAGDWSHFLYSKMKMLLNSFGFFFCLFSSGWEDVDLKLIFVFALARRDSFCIHTRVLVLWCTVVWHFGCVEEELLCVPPPPTTPIVLTGRFCSTETRKIQRCLFLKEKWGVSSCSISFPCIYVFLSRGSLILMLMKNMLWNEHICRD